MTMNREQRKQQHTSAKRRTVTTGPPQVADMNEGEPYVRYIPGSGLCVFYRYGAKIYYSQLTEGLP